jgi:hypothetical protein
MRTIEPGLERLCARAISRAARGQPSMLVLASRDRGTLDAFQSVAAGTAQQSGFRTASVAASDMGPRPHDLLRAILRRLGYEEPVLAPSPVRVQRVQLLAEGKPVLSFPSSGAKPPLRLLAALREAPDGFMVALEEPTGAVAAIRIGGSAAVAWCSAIPDPVQESALRRVATAGSAVEEGGLTGARKNCEASVRALLAPGEGGRRASPFEVAAARIESAASHRPLLIGIDSLERADYPSVLGLFRLAQAGPGLRLAVAASADPATVSAGSPLVAASAMRSASASYWIVTDSGSAAQLRPARGIEEDRTTGSQKKDSLAMAAAEAEAEGEWSWAARLWSRLQNFEPRGSSEHGRLLESEARALVKAGEGAKALEKIRTLRGARTGSAEQVAIIELEAYSLLRDAKATLESARKAKPLARAPGGRVVVATAEAHALLDMNRIEEARAAVAAVAASVEKAPPAAAADLLQARARLETLAGATSRAARTLEEAAEIARRSGDTGLEGQVLSNLGVLIFAEGDAVRALGLHRRAAGALWDAGDTSRLAYALNNEGFALSQIARAGTELEVFRRALSLSTMHGDRASRAFILVGLSGSLAALGRLSEAEAAASEAVALADSIGSSEIEEQALVALADLRLAQSRPAEALELYRRALRGAARSEARHFATAGAAQALLESGERVAAVREAKSALQSGRGALPPFASVSLLLTIAESAVSARDLRLASSALREARDSPAAGWRAASCRIARLEAALLAAEGKSAQARKAAAAAVELARGLCLWREARKSEELAARLRGEEAAAAGLLRRSRR